MEGVKKYFPQLFSSLILIGAFAISASARADNAPQIIPEWQDSSCHQCRALVAQYDTLADKYNSSASRGKNWKLASLQSQLHVKSGQLDECISYFCGRRPQHAALDTTPAYTAATVPVAATTSSTSSTWSAPSRFTSQPVPSSGPIHLSHIGYDLSLLGGALYVHRSGVITSTTIAGPAAGTQQSYFNSTNSVKPEVGFQARTIFDLNGRGQPFFYLNATSTLGSMSSLNMGVLNPPSPLTSNIVLTNNWNVHVGLGIQTEPLFNNLQMGIGAAVAFLNQSIKSYIGATNVTATYANQITNMRPSMMGILTWKLCPDCVGGLPASLGAEITVDSYTSIAVNGGLPAQNTYYASVNQQWVPHGDLLLMIGF